jgi:hypothetical protein
VKFVPAQPGSWKVIDHKIASHEAAHAAIAILLGLTVTEVCIDRPGDDGGICHIAPDPERLRSYLAALMAGPICGGTPLSWKPHGDPGSDGAACALLVEHFGMDEAAWDEGAARARSCERRNGHSVLSTVRGDAELEVRPIRRSAASASSDKKAPFAVASATYRQLLGWGATQATRGAGRTQSLLASGLLKCQCEPHTTGRSVHG